MAGTDRPGAGPSTCIDHETDEPDVDSPSRPDWLMRGQTIDRYLVLECLGVGGMGVIYSAWDPELDRKLAIKVVRARRGQRGSTRGRARLMREAQALARLRHPNVVAVHDVGTHEGRVFVAMEFIKGQTLHRWLLRSPRAPVSELLRVFLQIGRGLAAAHRAGLIHRDVKPENVMLGEDGRVLVLDFGIARENFGSESDVIEPIENERLLDAPDESEPDPELDPELGTDVSPLASLTRAGAVIGTPAYMSPEQHRGQRVDARSDQFSFCVAMWEALNGEKPFGEGSRQKLLVRMRLGQLRRFRNREVPRRVNATLRRGLSWHPGERFRTMEALLEALNPRGATAERRLWHGLGMGALGGMIIGVAVSMLSTGLRAPPPSSSVDCTASATGLQQRWNEASAAKLGEHFAGTATLLEVWPHTKTQIDAWAARWTHVREQTCADQFLPPSSAPPRHDQSVSCLENHRLRFETLLDLLEEAPETTLEGALSAARSLPAPEQCREVSRARFDHPKSGPSALWRDLDRLELRVELGSSTSDIEQVRRLRLAAHESGDLLLNSRSAKLEAHHLARLGQHAQACERLLEAARMADSLDDAELQARSLLAALPEFAIRGRHEEARHWFALAEQLTAELPDPSALALLLLEARAELERASGSPHAARQALLEARSLLERSGDSNGRLPVVLHELGRVALDLDAGDQALELLREALLTGQQTPGTSTQRLAEIHADLGRALELSEDPSAALGEYARAVELAEAEDPSGYAAAGFHGYIGSLLARQGQCEAAALALDTAVQRARGQKSIVLAEVLEGQALVCAASHPEAPALAREAVELREQLQGSVHPALARALVSESIALVEHGRAPSALSTLARAEFILAAHPQIDRHVLLFARGLALAQLDEQGQARILLEEARAGLPPRSEHLDRIGVILGTLGPAN